MTPSAGDHAGRSVRVLTLDQIKAAVDPPSARQCIADAFVAYSQHRATVPEPGELVFDQPPGDAHIKYGRLDGAHVFVVKVATGFYHNAQAGLPAQDGASLVFSCTTGLLECVLVDHGWLTDLRTALAGAVAAEHLAPSRVNRIGVVGTGTQARRQVEALRGVVDCTSLIAWGPSRRGLDRYCEDMRAEGYQVAAADAAGEAFMTCQLIITATPATRPVLKQVAPGTHITAVGADSPLKNELSAEVCGAIDLFSVDSLKQCEQRGELKHALAAGAVARETVVELGQLIAGTHAGRTDDRQITLTDLTGVAVQDIAIAAHVLRGNEQARHKSATDKRDTE